MTDAPRKPFWKGKCWIAAAVIWLAVAYPLSLGPAEYLAARTRNDWWVRWLYGPLDPVIFAGAEAGPVNPARSLLYRYEWWWISLAMEENHRDSE